VGDHSAIEWTDATWNPVTGCTIKQVGGRTPKAGGRLLGRTWDEMPGAPVGSGQNSATERLARAAPHS
jgi:protein gp37